MASIVFRTKDDIRAAFSEAMSQMYSLEVPLYGDLLNIVADVNHQVREAVQEDHEKSWQVGDFQRLGSERHGAIRLGSPAELCDMRRVFAVMGMAPVGYYDLAVAGVPVHSTAFRPIDGAALTRSPFRVFTSLLRLDLIKDEELRRCVQEILSNRRIFSERALELTARSEFQDGLTDVEAEAFVKEVLQTFRWRREALVDRLTYQRLNAAHRLVADVVSFKGPHINHLTPHTLDIDACQAEMVRRGMPVKDVVEGPPRRRVPILLRQTSFKALQESITFKGDAAKDQTKVGHTARFGEIEQRGVALTRKGRELYDCLLNEARGSEEQSAQAYEKRLTEVFCRFPDTLKSLRRQELAFFHYAPTEAGTVTKRSEKSLSLETMIEAGWVSAQPIIYEDFLPVSAAGIFQSNLAGKERRSYHGEPHQAMFEEALGAKVIDPLELYNALQAKSINDVCLTLGQPVRTAGVVV